MNMMQTEELETLKAKFKTATDALDRIACDPERLKRDDMVKLAWEALCEVGLWRKAMPGEFVRGGVSYGFPGGEAQQKS